MRLAWLIVALLALGSSQASARLRVGAVATAQWASLTSPPPLESPFPTTGPKREWIPAPAIGAVLEWDVLPTLSIEAEPQLVDQRDRVDYGVLFYFGGIELRSRTNSRLTSAALPVRAVWHPLRALRLRAGPEVRYLARATQTLETPPGRRPIARRDTGPMAAEAIIFEDFPLTFDATGDYRRWSFGLSAGAGVSWAVAEHDARLDLTWSQGLTDLTRLDDRTRTWQGVQASLSMLW